MDGPVATRGTGVQNGEEVMKRQKYTVKLLKETLSKSPCKDGRHLWRVSSYWAHGRALEESCQRCHSRRNRAATPPECAYLSKQDKEEQSSSQEHNVHYAWHGLVEQLQKADEETWKKQGYDLMLLAGHACKKYPDYVLPCGCDDSHFMSSDLILIQHKTPTEWMGITMLFIAQNGDPPAQMFLYPGHAKTLIGALKKCEAEQKRLAPITKAKERAERQEWKRIKRSQEVIVKAVPAKGRKP